MLLVCAWRAQTLGGARGGLLGSGDGLVACVRIPWVLLFVGPRPCCNSEQAVDTEDRLAHARGYGDGCHCKLATFQVFRPSVPVRCVHAQLAGITVFVPPQTTTPGTTDHVTSLGLA